MLEVSQIKTREVQDNAAANGRPKQRIPLKFINEYFKPPISCF